jgi:hypothetical protein
MKRILFAAGLIAASAPAYAQDNNKEGPLQPGESRRHETTIYGAPQHMTVQDSPLSPMILKGVKPGSDDDEIWGLSAPPGTSLTADLTAMIPEIAKKERTIKEALAKLARGNSETLLFAQDACRFSNEAGTVYHAAFQKFHDTVTRRAGSGEFRAYPEQRALDIASRRYTRAMRECLIATGAPTEKTEYACSDSTCTQQEPVEQTAEEPVEHRVAVAAENEVPSCSVASKASVCRASP